MFTATVTVDYPQRLKPAKFAVLPLIEQLAHGQGKVHDHAILRECPELLERVDQAHRLGALEHVVVNFDAESGGNVDRAQHFADELIKAFAQFSSVLGPEDLADYFAANDGRAYAYLVIKVNSIPVDQRLALIQLKRS